MAYTLTGKKSGTVRFVNGNGNVQSEQLNYTSTITSAPIEEGAELNDHIEKKPIRFSISGIVVGGTAEIARLQAMHDKRDIVTYTGRVRIDNLVIISLTMDYAASNQKGCSFKATFQQASFASAQFVELGSEPLMSQQDAKKAAAYAASQLQKTTMNGLQTTVSEVISSSTYAEYVCGDV